MELLFCFLLLIAGLASGTGSTTSRSCSGICMRDAGVCKTNGGSITGYCVNGSTCCDMTSKEISSCGDVKSGRQAFHFASPDYPSLISKDMICSVTLNLAHDAIAVRIDFLDVVMDGLGFAPHGAICESDMFFFKGFKSWTPPPLCGNLTGYATVIDRTVNNTRMDQLIVVALMSSSRYRWKFKITPVTQILSKSRQESPASSPSARGNHRRRTRSDLRRLKRDSMIMIDEDVPVFDTLERPMVTNGENTSSHEVPWQASIRSILSFEELSKSVDEGSRSDTTTMSSADQQALDAKRKCIAEDGLHFCGGSIIADRYILTAAHCFYATSKMMDFLPLENVKVVLGDMNRCVNDLRTSSNGHLQQDHEIESVVFHYAYDPVSVMNDVAVIKLKHPITYKQNIKKVRLAPPTKHSWAGTRAFVSGWGMTNLTEENSGKLNAPYILQSSHNFVISNQSLCDMEQAKHFGQNPATITSAPKYVNVFESVICTNSLSSSESVHVGQGDSGGPLVVPAPRNQGSFLLGIVSHSVPRSGTDIVEEPTDFFMSVPFYHDWIKLAMVE